MKRAYLKKIFKILAAVDSVWVLEQLYRFAVNMTRDDLEARVRKELFEK